MIGREYLKPLYILLDNGLIERTGNAFPSFKNSYGVTIKGECYEYRVNPKLIDEQKPIKTKFKYVERTPTYKEYKLQKEYKSDFIRDFETLDIPYMKLYNEVENHTQNIEDLDKRVYVTNAWLEAIDNLKEGNLYAKRKNRLYSNFTNLSKILLGIIKEHNGLVESDVKCSQPAFLAYLLEKEGIYSPDISEFQKLVNESDLYLHFKKDGMSRDEAKNLMFQIFFGKLESNHYENVKMFGREFPNVLNYINDYKTKKGKAYNDFAILLQTTESKVFIDGIYPKLRALNIPFFTKHDSIIYNKKDAELVQKVMHDYFNEIGFKGQLDHEYQIAQSTQTNIAI